MCVYLNEQRPGLVFAGLLFLCLAPVGGGAMRMYWMNGGAGMPQTDGRFLADPTPIVIHIVTALLFCYSLTTQF